jgi:cytochrome c-type biogenesis protein CcmH/NrfG
MNMTSESADKLKVRISHLISMPSDYAMVQREEGVALARQALSAGRTDLAIPLLQRLVAQDRNDLACQTLLGFGLRQEQQLLDADAVFTDSLQKNPAHPPFMFGQAQTRYELGLPAASLFARAQEAMPDNFDIIRNRAAAMASEGDVAGAETLLSETLVQHPDWMDGHTVISALRWTHGDQQNFACSYEAACKAEPQNAALWIAWFSAIAQTRNWPDCVDILARAEKVLGQTASIVAARLFVACESGNTQQAEDYLALSAHIKGDTINLCRIRHFIRQRRLPDALAVIMPLVQSGSAALFWPYLSLIWRLQGNARHLWLDRPDILIKSLAVDLTTAEYAELAEVLRALHTQQQPYLEQSVRGGTQTDRSVMLRHEPILQQTRTRWLEVIRNYVSALPAVEEGHPLLGVPRKQLMIEGSWSVRLLKQGRNVPHTHPRGWLSTAFYISLPSPENMGPAPAGHIAFGMPPEDLGLDLPPYCTIKPIVGQTAVFASTMWHSTIPFEDGERLVLALDVQHPKW